MATIIECQSAPSQARLSYKKRQQISPFLVSPNNRPPVTQLHRSVFKMHHDHHHCQGPHCQHMQVHHMEPSYPTAYDLPHHHSYHPLSLHPTAADTTDIYGQPPQYLHESYHRGEYRAEHYSNEHDQYHDQHYYSEPSPEPPRSQSASPTHRVVKTRRRFSYQTKAAMLQFLEMPQYLPKVKDPHGPRVLRRPTYREVNANFTVSMSMLSDWSKSRNKIFQKAGGPVEDIELYLKPLVRHREAEQDADHELEEYIGDMGAAYGMSE